MQNNIGHFLKEHLNRCRISYRKFETDTGINRSNLTHYINGTREPSVSRLVEIADYFTRYDLQQIEGLATAQKTNLRATYLLRMLNICEPSQMVVLTGGVNA